MPTGYQINKQDKLHFVTLQIVVGLTYLPVKYRDIIISNLACCQKNKGLEIFARVIMSNHMHLLVKIEREDLSSFL